MNNYNFAYPEFFWLLILVPVLIAVYIWRNNRTRASLKISSLRLFEKSAPGWRVRLRHLPFVFRLLGIVFLIIVLARPQSTSRWENVTTKGIDIILAMDISSSMLAEDFKPNRLEAAKSVAMEFISGRPNDRIGLVVFSGESFTQCPLTTDHAVLLNLFKDIKSGMIEDGTAIGLGLANAVNRLKDSDAKSKVVILLTDGVNNRGEISPLTAAEIARTFGIRVYTIGVGTIGKAPYPFQTPYGRQYQNIDVKIDEAVLQQISQRTDGQYFRATNNQKLKEIYQKIDQLEKSKIEVKEISRKSEEYQPFLAIALIALFLFLLLTGTVFKQNP
ncbi:MAG: VWA domain-containing protein [Bacteroidales bacterium]|nr:VWA domain-containing protein [Bacteroidales bacterium]